MSAGTATLPLGPLTDYLRAQGLAGVEPIRVAPLSGGQSNPTFRITADQNAYVLRKKPAGVLAPSAHAIDREYRVMRALHGTDVPVPRMLAYCEDASIVGTPFYLMDFLQGRVFMDPALPDSTPAERGAIYREMGRVIAALHSVDPVAVGLADYGRTGQYVQRQIDRWSRQCRALTVPLDDDMRKLMDWLPTQVPPGDETTLVHGDYRLDNLVWHRSEAQIIGVLDWELTTLGDPLMDLGNTLAYWIEADDPAPVQLMRRQPSNAPGMLTRREFVDYYAERSGIQIDNYDFYYTYGLFRLAGIVQQIYYRYYHGQTADKRFAQFIQMNALLEQMSLNVIRRSSL